MIDIATGPYGALILRLSLGIMFVAHGMLKVRVFTIPGQSLDSACLPLCNDCRRVDRWRRAHSGDMSALCFTVADSDHHWVDHNAARQERLVVQQ